MNFFVFAGLVVLALLAVDHKISKKPEEPVKGERYLLVGDSFAVGLTAPLSAIAKQAGVEFRAISKSGTRIDQWAKSKELRKQLEDYKPTFVFVSLGTNDEFMGDGVVEKQRAALHQILTELGQTDFLWIGPPALKGHLSNGIVAMLQEELENPAAPNGARGYFHSERLDIPRSPDGLHPTAAGYKQWADAIWRRDDSGH